MRLPLAATLNWDPETSTESLNQVTIGGGVLRGGVQSMIPS